MVFNRIHNKIFRIRGSTFAIAMFIKPILHIEKSPNSEETEKSLY